MVTIKFKVEKLESNEALLLPCALFIKGNNKKNGFGLCFGWFKGMLIIGVEWSRKIKMAKA
jgi:hypothetical protein